MTYATWEPRFRVTTVQPGALDLFVATFLDGQRAALQPISEYDDALSKARAFHRDHACQIKVLPLTGPEARNFLGIEPAEKPEPIEPSERQRMVDMLMRIARDSNDDARGEAFDLLKDMGAIKL